MNDMLIYKIYENQTRVHFHNLISNIAIEDFQFEKIKYFLNSITNEELKLYSILSLKGFLSDYLINIIANDKRMFEEHLKYFILSNIPNLQNYKNQLKKGAVIEIIDLSSNDGYIYYLIEFTNHKTLSILFNTNEYRYKDDIYLYIKDKFTSNNKKLDVDYVGMKVLTPELLLYSDYSNLSPGENKDELRYISEYLDFLQYLIIEELSIIFNLIPKQSVYKLLSKNEVDELCNIMKPYILDYDELKNFLLRKKTESIGKIRYKTTNSNLTLFLIGLIQNKYFEISEIKNLFENNGNKFNSYSDISSKLSNDKNNRNKVDKDLFESLSNLQYLNNYAYKNILSLGKVKQN